MKKIFLLLSFWLVAYGLPQADTVEADGIMTYEGAYGSSGSYEVHAKYDAEKSTLTLTGVGDKSNSGIIFNVTDDGSLESEKNQLYYYDYDDDDDGYYRNYPVYYSDNSDGDAPTPYRVTGTAENSGENCVLTLGDIGGFNTLYNMFTPRWNNTVITLYDLNLNKDIPTFVESVEATDADARYFTLQGVEIWKPEAGTICIKVSGNKATKIVIR